MSCILFSEILLMFYVCCAAATAGLLPQDKCGISYVPNNGTNANKTLLQEYPWIAALKYTVGEGKEAKIWCTGTLISKRYILTAAHCLSSSRLTLVGITLGNSEGNGPPLQEFNVSKSDIIIHPDLKRKAKTNDIALIRLPKDADDSTTPVCLPLQDNAKSNQFTHNLTVAGWFTPYNYSHPRLEKVSVPVIPNTQCAQKYREQQIFPVDINEKQLCAGDATSLDTCAANAGSSLMDEVDSAGVVRTVQYGIVSFGIAGCIRTSNEYPRVYTRVSSYTDWIMDNIKQ